jgi:hypothetical protein
VQFDNVYEEVYTGRDIADVPSLALVPRGSTAMLDGIGRAVNATGARLAAMPEDGRPGTVIVGIMTDGLEILFPFVEKGVFNSYSQRRF